MNLIDIENERTQKAIEAATEAAYKKIGKFIVEKGSISMQFREQLKTEIEIIVSKYISWN
jgi:hypothetical protein